MPAHRRAEGRLMAGGPHILIVEARYYEDIVDGLLHGAEQAFAEAGATFERLTVPGAFEIPAAIARAIEAGGADGPAGGARYDGYLALGCVIRGETSHYDYICTESARKLQDLACDKGAALGYGILTCENWDQAWARANVEERNKGGEAARACLAMIAVNGRFAGRQD
jgi:6,7-dimethyl-8-ribityllumazine synthase